MQQTAAPFQQGGAYAKGHHDSPAKAQDVTCPFPYAQQGLCDIAVLSSQGRGRKPKLCKKWNEGSTGVEGRSLSLEVLPQG